jgi:hypothetical protein
MSTLERAIAIAAEAHAGQVDKGGAPYILHPLRVMLGVFTEEERIVAALHDVVEDCPSWPLSRLRAEMGWSAEEPMLMALNALTRRKGESYEDFIDRVRQNELARRVKLSDLADNSDTSRLNRPLTPADRARLERYWRAVTALAYTGQQKTPPPIP